MDRFENQDVVSSPETGQLMHECIVFEGSGGGRSNLDLEMYVILAFCWQRTATPMAHRSSGRCTVAPAARSACSMMCVRCIMNGPLVACAPRYDATKCGSLSGDQCGKDGINPACQLCTSRLIEAIVACRRYVVQ